MAVTISVADLAERIGGVAVDDDQSPSDAATSLLAAAAAMIEQYSPAAPEALQNEAAVRFAGYLAQSEFGAVESDNVGPTTVSYVTNHAAMFRNSGAAALVSRWRTRRAGAIG